MFYEELEFWWEVNNEFLLFKQPLQWFWTWKNFHRVHAGHSVRSVGSSSWQRLLPPSAVWPGWCVSWQPWLGMKVFPGEIFAWEYNQTLLGIFLFICFHICLFCSCFFFCSCMAGCCLIPFCLDRFKSTTHRCPKCQTSIQTIKKLWEKSSWWQLFFPQ